MGISISFRALDFNIWDGVSFNRIMDHVSENRQQSLAFSEVENLLT